MSVLKVYVEILVHNLVELVVTRELQVGLSNVNSRLITILVSQINGMSSCTVLDKAKK